MCLNDQMYKEYNISLGDEVFIVGLFRHHVGSLKNIPIVRVGNLAALNEEKVVTPSGERDAYLIEARSIGGLSGSPVFFNLGSVRAFGEDLKFLKKPIFILSGLIHGHYDVENLNEDNANEDSLTPEKINTGIAIVTPIHKVIETIEYHAQAGTKKCAIALELILPP